MPNGFCLPIFPEVAIQHAQFFLWLSVAAILYGGYMALAQSDLKRLVAYSSVSHMGFVTLGIFSFTREGIEGAILQMGTHGITTGALFLIVGQLYDRTHSRAMADYGGLHQRMPRFVAILSLFAVASFGLPATLLIDTRGCVLGALNGPAEWDHDDAKKLINAAL